MQMVPHFFYPGMDPGDYFVSKGYLVCFFLREASVCFSPHKSGKGYRCLTQEKSWTVLTQRRRSGWLRKICLDPHNLEERSKCELYYRQKKSNWFHMHGLCCPPRTPPLSDPHRNLEGTQRQEGEECSLLSPPLAGADGRVKRFQMLPFSTCGHVPLPHLTTITKKTGQGHL